MTPKSFAVWGQVEQLRDSLGSIKPGEFTPKEAMTLSNALLRLGYLVQAEVPDDFCRLLEAAVEEDRSRTSPETPVGDLGFSVRTLNCLSFNVTETLGDLVKLTERDLLNIRHFGCKSLEEVKNKLEALGLSLKQRSLAGPEDKDDDLYDLDDDDWFNL